jgi:tetratricopeptide (TPR) repeat protein
LIRLRGVAPIAFLALVVGGCPAALPPNLREATIKPGDLPGSIEEILKYAEDESHKETAAAEENVIVAVDHGLSKDPRNYELLWRGARASAWITEEFTDGGRRASYAQKGIDYAKRAVEVDPKRVEAYYYLGINLGQSATTKTVGAYTMVPKVVKAAQAAMKIDERFDHAGPARLIGTVYAKAPPWPASIGDIDEGIKYLARAVELAPDYPQNHLHYGDALVSDSKLNEAEREYKIVLDAKVPPELEHRAERWKRDADAGLKKIAEKRSDS